MSGSFSVGGLVSGLDSNTLIAQLMQIERQPVTRMQQRVSALTTQRTTMNELRTQLQTLRNVAYDFKLKSTFSKFSATSSDTDVATASASLGSPVSGAYTIDVTRLASATVVRGAGAIGAPINPDATLASTGMVNTVSAGTFSVNGVQFTVDPATQSLNQVLSAINSSAAGVTATYDSARDRVVFTNSTPGSTNFINFGVTGDTSNFLEAINVRTATQSTNTSGTTEVVGTRNLGAANVGATLNTVSFSGGAMTSGTFSINGVAFTVDTAADSLSDVLGRINSSDAQVTATYDSASDTVRIASKTLGSRTVNFSAGTSNFISLMKLDTATQVVGQDAQFTVNGGDVQTRNSNEVTDAIADVTLNFKSLGTTTVTVGADDSGVIDSVKAFLDSVNATLTRLRELTSNDGDFSGDALLSEIDSTIKTTVLGLVSGIGGSYTTLGDIGISTGETFDSKAVTQYSLDETKFKEALAKDRGNVTNLFTNSGGTGVGDVLKTYLETMTGTSGPLNERVKTGGTYDRMLQDYNDRIEQMERRLELKETRLRQQFTRLETMSANFQSQSASLSRISSGSSVF